MNRNKQQQVKQESKVLVFPGNEADLNAPSFQLVLTPITLGKGQFGMVHFAHSRHDHNQVFAVKVIDRQKVLNQRANQNLQNEIAIMAEISSPYVVALKDATKTANNFYLAMELCNGGDLANLCKVRGGYLKEKECRVLFKQIISGLTAIKKTMVMHRDLKLPNIMIHFPKLPERASIDPSFNMTEFQRTVEITEENVQCKIADLGFARKLGVDEMAMTACGTPLQMPPEVLEGKLYDHKADVWSLGCIFYEMLCGFPPFTGRNQVDLTNNIAKGVYKFPKTLKISIEGLTFLNQMLQYDYNLRLQWEELQKLPYISMTQDPLQDCPDELFMSYCQTKHQFLPENVDQKTKQSLDMHNAVIKSPYNWMNQNPEKAMILNARDDTKLQDLIQQRYMKYQERLQKEEDQNVQNLKQSQIVKNLQKEAKQDDDVDQLVKDQQMNQPQLNEKKSSLNDSDNFKTAVDQEELKQQQQEQNQQNSNQQEQNAGQGKEEQKVIEEVKEQVQQQKLQDKPDPQVQVQQTFNAKDYEKPLSMDNTEYKHLAGQQKDEQQHNNQILIDQSQKFQDVLQDLTEEEQNKLANNNSPATFVDMTDESIYPLVEGKKTKICRNLQEPNKIVNANNLLVKKNFF